MAWFDTLLDHFALYPAHLFALLFVMALSKSTVLISSVLPPASVMLLAGISVSAQALGLPAPDGADAWLGLAAAFDAVFAAAGLLLFGFMYTGDDA